ncbi:hypothetical protein PMAYCL1PPCAC_29994, partial [Pristionchus mayeri]
MATQWHYQSADIDGIVVVLLHPWQHLSCVLKCLMEDSQPRFALIRSISVSETGVVEHEISMMNEGVRNPIGERKTKRIDVARERRGELTEGSEGIYSFFDCLVSVGLCGCENGLAEGSLRERSNGFLLNVRCEEHRFA